LLPRVTFGTHSRESVTAVRSLEFNQARTSGEQAGILGGNFHRAIDLTFDFEFG